ncbi:nucleotidyl transferase AbiEii/AbiGii toxin family protein [Taibaiella helva]|uniref:nucleotidyl transferase AbiEii/AbiGii toxin family protein n=1 Tax=Taibaiella helva TaxID=2301235 RepID=UPI000E585513|nr:nucleotidyl transferase AbiEii/AbiGii toxin family protein [Taibaiella helva]
MLYKKTVDPETLGLIQSLMLEQTLSSFYLAGGTALALKLGHRKSIDIDLFTHSNFDVDFLSHYLEGKFDAEVEQTAKNTIHGYIKKVKVDLIAHQYPLIKEIETIDGVRMLSLHDIAAMKLLAINDNGSRIKDFVDIGALLDKLSLGEMLEAYQKKYPNADENIVLRSLTYFENIDLRTETLIQTQRPFEWKQIAKKLTEAVQKHREGRHVTLSKPRQYPPLENKGKSKGLRR